jgi:hypothetical protein
MRGGCGGARFRQRTPEDVADEMAELYHRRGVRQFVFHDDNFLVPSRAHNRARIARFDAALAARGVRDVGLVLKCSPRDAERESLAALRELGLLRLFMGVESGSACGLASIGRRQRVEESERALSLCRSLGISTQYTLIIFHPEATAESMLADLAFAERHPAHPMNYCRAEIYAGTPLEARMRAAGRLEGTALAPTYRYTDPKVALVWALGSELFAGRCWGEDELLGSVIRLDHQVAVLDRFYEGPRARALAASFRAWQVDLNLETAGLFRELVLACAEAPAGGDPALARALADLRRREAPARAARLARLCEYRRALARYADVSVALGRRHGATPRSGRRLGPRHVGAVAVAIGVLGCAVAHDRGVAEAAPPPLDRTPSGPPPPPRARDPQPCVVTPAPPPRPALEPPEPPFRHDVGVAEAAPPPYHDRPRPLPAPYFEIRTRPAVPLRFRDAAVAQPFAYRADGEPLVVGEGTGAVPIRARVTLRRQPHGRAQAAVESDEPLTVRCGGTSAAAPAQVALGAGRGGDDAFVLVLEDPRSGARIEVRVVAR